jgi:hypothetical protein
MTQISNILLDEKQYTRKGTYNFSSSAKESRGDNVPDVNIIDLTPSLANSSKAIPGLKHHQLSVLDTLPATLK